MAKTVKMSDLRANSDEQMAEFVKTTTNEILATRFQNYTNKLNDTSRVGKLRRDLARAMTVMKARRTTAPVAESLEKADTQSQGVDR